ncbi:hypothetical protein DTO217A2_3742 [Paecilomyces variotii]|nr:hypothetical protein DTO217A2_3742 [Paecilomyces variotii]
MPTLHSSFAHYLTTTHTRFDSIGISTSSSDSIPLVCLALSLPRKGPYRDGVPVTNTTQGGLVFDIVAKERDTLCEEGQLQSSIDSPVSTVPSPIPSATKPELFYFEIQKIPRLSLINRGLQIPGLASILYQLSIHRFTEPFLNRVLSKHVPYPDLDIPVEPSYY